MNFSTPAVAATTLAIIVIGLFFMFGGDPGSEEPWSTRKTQLTQTAENAQSLIDTVNQYIRFKGEPPDNLESMVPDFMSEVPEPGLPGCGRFKFLNLGAGKLSVVWYDLGLRSGPQKSSRRLSVDGDPRHAILALTLNQNDIVIDARFERMPKNAGKLTFDSRQWKERSNRLEMALQLPDYMNLSKMPRTALEEQMGPPDGTRIQRDTPWELRVACPQGFTKRELFFYWPTEEYPEMIYGGDTEPVGRWVYVHKP
ncbi:MAG: hypothetical protein GY703_05900 [Gammaproteobacteria bacterium]|nr:hypothetical protein [Gammaproteobacteria bacterium]